MLSLGLLGDLVSIYSMFLHFLNASPYLLDTEQSCRQGASLWNTMGPGKSLCSYRILKVFKECSLSLKDLVLTIT